MAPSDDMECKQNKEGGDFGCSLGHVGVKIREETKRPLLVKRGLDSVDFEDCSNQQHDCNVVFLLTL